MTFEEAIEELKKKYPVVIATAEQIAEAMAEMDAVSVIRCKDCKYRDANECRYPSGMVFSRDNDFCSYAKRRKGEDE